MALFLRVLCEAVQRDEIDYVTIIEESALFSMYTPVRRC